MANNLDLSLIEISHRSPDFVEVMEKARGLVLELLDLKGKGYSALFLQGEVKQSIAGHRAETKSVDTGRFLNSVKNVQNKLLTASIESNVLYAKHLEFGTSRMKPRRHFTNTSLETHYQ